MQSKKQRLIITTEILALAFLIGTCLGQHHYLSSSGKINAVMSAPGTESTEQNNYIKWVDFNVTADAMQDAYEYDVETSLEEIHLDWIALLAYQACKNGGNFSKYKSGDMSEVAEKLISKETTLKSLTEDLKYYDYYYEAYSAVLGGLVGNYEIQTPEDSSGNMVWEKRYGLKGFHPIAKSFPYSDYDDFGASRSYGYSRPHLGHDMMGQVGTPIIAVESGYVEAIGWNQYGGWRLGIRSFDKKRYYYYAHLRQNYPYAEGLKEGSAVTAGDVIGYMGHTGYSTTENVNNIKTVHLHWGLQLIFDESQKDGNNEIWVNCYELTKFLYRNRSEAAKIGDSKEWKRICDMKDPAVEQWENQQQENTDSMAD